MEVGASTLGVALRVNLTFGCTMGDATLGDLGWTLGAMRGFCGSGAGGIESLWMGEAEGLPFFWRWGGERLLEMSACWPKCGSMVVWRSDSGNGGWFLQWIEEVVESGYCMELAIAGGGGSIGDGVGDGIEAVDNCVGWCDSQDGEVVVTEVDFVRDAEGHGFGIDEAMAAVMLKGDANVESVRAAEVPGAASG
jgi:hypothetical protein